MKKQFIYLLFLLLGFIPSCKKAETNTNPNILKQTIKLHGTVVDQDMKPISGASINFNGLTTTSNGGFYLFDNATITEGRLLVKASLSGYFDGIVGFEATASTSAQVKIVLVKKMLTGTISGATGGTITDGTSEVTLVANGLKTSTGVAYTGTANLYTHFYNPGDANFSLMTPGGDLNARNTAGEEKQLMSLGMMAVKMEDGTGKELQVASGKTATIKLPIDPGQLANAPATIKLWHLDETSGIWKEEGTATKTGNFYIGTVTHFSTWNCDKEATTARIKGVIVDCDGKYVAAADASVSDATPGSSNRPQNNFQLENQGKFSVKVASGFPLTFNIYPYGDRSNPKTISIPALSPGQVYDAGTIAIPCGTRVKGRLVDCAGNLVSGMLKIESGVSSMNVDVWNGVIDFNLGLNKTYTLTPYCLSKALFGNPITLNSGTTVSTADKGDIITCPCNGSVDSNDITKTTFTVNGGSFSNEQFKFEANSGAPIAILVADDTTYRVTASGKKLTTGEVMSVVVQFAGLTPGTYQIDPDKTNQGFGQVIITVGSGTTVKQFIGKSGTIVVSEVSTSGQPVNATYSGSFDYMNGVGGTLETVTISGTIKAKRYQ